MKLEFSKTVKKTQSINTNAVKVVALTKNIYFVDELGRTINLNADKDYNLPTRITFENGNIILTGEFNEETDFRCK